MEPIKTILNTGLHLQSTAIDYEHVEWEKHCRTEDMAYREIEIQRRLVGK